jgi:hypothetical protein
MACANPMCTCLEADDAGFCSDRCRQHGTENTPGGSCDCGHRSCTGEDVPLQAA